MTKTTVTEAAGGLKPFNKISHAAICHQGRTIYCVKTFNL